MSNLEFIYKRHSVRKFTDQEVPIEDLKKILEAATYCASAKNVQNWHFVVVKNKEKIEEMAKAIEEKNACIAEDIKNEEKKASFTKFVRFATVFRNAPVAIAIYAGPYTPTGLDELTEIGGYEAEINHLLEMSPKMQSVGAAIENLSLAAAEMGYGTCWMTSGNYAAKEVSDVIGFEKENFALAAIVPIGVPDGPIKSPGRKPVEEVTTVIE
ncbi:nitroreductase family protein [Clostridium ganghwense]|uniref:Nitroreductase family protein n=1 Tax=Clostridium ganghwense TaxID=312089 RepID=A0ABT4CJQ6_9CLOT|nr:nitroreductase family protein [Clostridium ganghwense]MCY6369282.1 nitroreductase family protein [Clostridium ganghwense]